MPRTPLNNTSSLQMTVSEVAIWMCHVSHSAHCLLLLVLLVVLNLLVLLLVQRKHPPC